jgi:hypothetical protein
MPLVKQPQREAAEGWEQLRLYASWPQQVAYELLRPIVIFGRTPGARAAEVGVPERKLRRKAEHFDAVGMDSLFATPHPSPQLYLSPLEALPLATDASTAALSPATRLTPDCGASTNAAVSTG